MDHVDPSSVICFRPTYHLGLMLRIYSRRLVSSRPKLLPINFVRSLSSSQSLKMPGDPSDGLDPNAAASKPRLTLPPNVGGQDAGGGESLRSYRCLTCSLSSGDMSDEADQLAGITAGEVDTYLQDKLALPAFFEDKLLEQARQKASEAGIPDIAVSPMQGQYLYILCKSIAAARVLEIGTLWG